MSTIKPPSEKQLVQAATLRAAGISWATIGKQLRRKTEHVEKWPELIPELWKKHYSAAAEQLAREVMAESVSALRSDLRQTVDDKARREAASKLLNFGINTLNDRPRSKSKDQLKREELLPSSAGIRFAKHVESLSPDELAKLIRDLGYIRQDPSADPQP